MVTDDTIELLRECDAGIRMGISSLDQVIPKVKGDKFRGILETSKSNHEKLQAELQQYLSKAQCEGQAPNPMAQGMSWMKTSVMTTMDDRDETIADLMTDGCDMGVKSLRKYLNQYENANEEASSICRKIIQEEEDLRNKMKEFL